MSYYEENYPPESFGIGNIKETCPHEGRIKSLYGPCGLGTARYGDFYGYILCLSCAVERFPNPERRAGLFCTEIGYIGDWTAHIVVDVTPCCA